jgi:hypothetical protein
MLYRFKTYSEKYFLNVLYSDLNIFVIGAESMVSIMFPLATNIKSLQRWGDNDISKRLKQSLILYDKIIIETGTYNFQGGKAVIQGYDPWDEKNSKEVVLEKLLKIENKQDDGYITVIDGKTHLEKYKYKVEKKDWFLADYRTVDVISEIESGSYGKKIDFLEYLDVNRFQDYRGKIQENTVKDLSDKEFAEEVVKMHGSMPTIAFLNNLNDSLAMSHALNMPVAVDSIYASLLKMKTKCKMGLQYTVLERLSKKIGVPDFGDLSLEKILELRKDRALTSFRMFISQLSVKLQSENNLNVESLFTQELLKELKELAPNKKRLVFTTFLGALSNINYPFVGTITTIADIGKEFREYRNFSSKWLSFLLKASE